MKILTKVIEEKVTRVKTPTNKLLIKGAVKVLDWQGNPGSLIMNPTEFACNGAITKEILKDSLNDGGFGGVDIIGGIIDLFQKIEVSEAVEGDNPRVALTEEYEIIESDIHVGNTKGLEEAMGGLE